MSKVLISFIGSHDLNRNRETNGAGPIEQLMNYIKPTKSYLFVSDEYWEEFKNNNLENFYKNLQEKDVVIISTDIENPTDHNEIANKLSNYIENINGEILLNKWQGFVNLTSGTPAMISVLSLFVMTGQLNRTHGVYAPNPKYDNQVKLTAIEFYKNSFTYKTLKDMINLMDYIAIEDFLAKNKNVFPKLEERDDFKNIVKFTKNRMICNYDKAFEFYNKYDYLKQYQYNIPTNLYEKSAELYMSAKISERNADDFQATLKAGIVREILTTFLIKKLLKRLNIDILEDRQLENGTNMIFFKQENIEKYPKLFEYLENKLRTSNSINKTFDKNRDVNSNTQGNILDFCIEQKSNENLLNIQKEFFKLEKLRAERNKLAHSISSPKYSNTWLKILENIINLISDEFNLTKPDYEFYTKINNNLLEILKETLNG